jgi:heme-degrading monooxygenase HmoA
VHARTMTVQADPRAVDRGVTFLHDRVMPAVEGLPGYVGLSMLADRDSGHCIATTAWVDEAAMQATAQQLRPLRARFAELLEGRAQVQTWEIGALHRVHETPDGAWTRVTWTRGPADRAEQALDTYRMGLLPRLEDLPGFCSASLLVDTAEGLAAGSVTVADRTALAAAREPAAALEAEFARATGVEVVEVAEYELVLAHLRVPETA